MPFHHVIPITTASWLPSGYEAYTVGGQTYVVYQLDPGMGATASMYMAHDGDVTTTPQPVSVDQWEAMSADWVDGVTTQGLMTDPDTMGRSWSDIVDNFLYESGLYSTDALSDPTVVAVLAEWVARPDMTDDELQNRLRETDTWQSSTQKQLDWNNYSVPEQQQMILDEAQKLLPLWQTYTGDAIDWMGFDTGPISGDQPDMGADPMPGVSVAELMVANPDLYEWAEGIASGTTTQITAVNEWVKTAANDIENSPHLRRIEAEQVARGQKSVDIATNRGIVMDLYHRYGVDVTEETATGLGSQLYLNETALVDVEGQVKDASDAAWSNKPRDTDFVSWASPFLNMYASTLETAMPTFRDPMVAEFLQSTEAPTLSEFKRKLRGDERWQSTQNARDAYHSTYSQIGRLMGFV